MVQYLLMNNLNFKEMSQDGEENTHAQQQHIKQNICYVGQDKIIITFNKWVFELSRQAQRIQNLQFIKKQTTIAQQQGNWIQTIKFDCLYGVIQLQKTVALILIVKGTEVAKINQNAVYQVQQTKIIHVKNIENEPFTSPLQLSFKLFKVYYCHQYDLSKRLQSQFQQNQNHQVKYISNIHHTQCQQYPPQLTTICIIGLVKSYSYYINDIFLTITVVSRANVNRIGRRWFRRGLDIHGNTANQYETELIWQVVSKQNRQMYSYVQLRGSIPLFWQQTAGVNRIQISQNDEKNANQMKRYLSNLNQSYGGITLLNLIEKTGRQQKIGTLYKKYFEEVKSDNTNFIWFDFGTQYKHKNLIAFQQLMDQLKKFIKDQFFSVTILKDGSVKVENQQKRVIRSNCMDCLDRTNYIQNLISKYVCIQLQSKIFGPHQQINIFPLAFKFPQLQDCTQILWKENGFAISQQYAGTPPMKSDFLLYNKRTVKGQIDDFWVGSKRIYLGYYYDFYYQNCIDLHFGKINYQKDSEQFSPNLQKRFLQLLSFSGVIVFPYILKEKIIQNCKEKILQFTYFAGASLAGLVLGGVVTKICSKQLLQLPISRKYEQL